MYLRSCVKKADKIFNSSSVLSFAIEQASIEINVTNSQFGMINPPYIVYVELMFLLSVI